MIPELRPTRLMPSAIAVLAALGLARAVHAQDDGFDDLEAAPRQPVLQRQVMISESNFDLAVFGNSRSASAARRQLETQLKVQLNEVDRIARLTEAQKEKLDLASRGDIKRFFDLVEAKRKEFQLVRTDPQKYSAFYQELRPLSLAFNAGLFGEESIFMKTLKKTLDAEQAARYEEVVRDRRLNQQRARIALVVAKLDNLVGLNAEQRGRLMKLIAEETRPPKKSSPYDFQVVMLQLARLPEERVMQGLNDAQKKLLNQQFAFAQRYERVLMSQDVLPENK